MEGLSNSLNLLENLQYDIPNTEAQFEPLHDRFNILRKYEVQIPEEVELQLEKLQGNWMAFQQCLIDSESMLKKHKVRMYMGTHVRGWVCPSGCGHPARLRGGHGKRFKMHLWQSQVENEH